MASLSALPPADPTSRAPRPNSVPRTIGLFGLGKGGAALVVSALAAGVRAMPMSLASVGQFDGRPPSAPDVNAIVVVARTDDDVGGAAEIYDWARQIGVLVTAVVISEGPSPVAVGENVSELRVNSDLLAITSDDGFLGTMLEWLAAPADAD